MPERLAGSCIQREKVSVSIAREGEPGIGGQYAGARASWPELMRPANLARLVVDCFEHALAPQAHNPRPPNQRSHPPVC